MSTIKNLKINNVFGIKPTFNHEAAGLDFYIPNISGELSDEKRAAVFAAFSKSYNKTVEELMTILDRLNLQLLAVTDNNEALLSQQMNYLHLFLSTQLLQTYDSLDDAVDDFVDNYICFDDNGTAGMFVHLDEHIKINSGIKMDIPSGICGLYVNKSGRGTKGWDVRAQLVDPDYAGYVHMSVAFTSPFEVDSEIYCGDKLTQMIMLPYAVVNEISEVSDEEYTKLKSSSKRGDAGFGSSNEKH